MHTSREDVNSKYLLYPTEFNYLSDQIARKYKSDTPSENANSFHVIKRGKKKYVICPVSKDAQTPTNESSLKFLGDIITEFVATLSSRSDRDYHLLLPMRLCRGFLKIRPSVPYAQREHLVLVELDLRNMSFQVHDSQGSTLQKIYPDKLSEMETIAGVNVSYDQALDYHAYGVQDDRFSCGYYVLAYMETIIATGNSAKCVTVKLNIQKDYIDKKDYFNQHGVPEYIAYINGQPVKDRQSSSIDDFDLDSDAESSGDEGRMESAKDHRQDHAYGKNKFSPLLSSGIFTNSDYIVELDPVINEGSQPRKNT